MYTLLYVLLSLFLLLFILSLIAPKTYDVFRTVEIVKPQAEVFNYLRSLQKMDEWSPWARKDPNMQETITGTDGEVGCISHWTGNKDVGEGEQEIKRIIGGKRIESELRFLKPFKSTSDCYMDVNTLDHVNTQVKWGFSGKYKGPMIIMSLYKNMDAYVGPDFEEGMANLKEVLEK